MSPLAALLRYQTALLTRSHRWLPPLLLYAAIMVIGVQWGGPVLDALGWAAAGLLPIAAWLVRVCVTSEPEAARHCAAAAAGSWRVHLSSVLVALGAAGVLGTAGTLVVVAISDPHSADGRTEVPVLPAAGAGLLAAIACALFGTAVGALCNRPLLRSTGYAVATTVFGALMVLVLSGSPANAAVSGLVTGSLTGTVTVPWLPFFAALLTASAATALACGLAPRRG